MTVKQVADSLRGQLARQHTSSSSCYLAANETNAEHMHGNSKCVWSCLLPADAVDECEMVQEKKKAAS
jgi:hypothetical protein